ncbi:uncharacterized protein isoform X2 [Choristoneura fumiferana]
MKLYFQNTRNASGDDSGEQGSNSSMSSDDCMSTRTGYSSRLGRNYKENVPQSLPSLDARSMETNFREDIRDIRQQAMKNPSRRDPENVKSLHNKPNNIFNSQMNHKNTLPSQGHFLSGPRNVFSSQSYMNSHENGVSSQRNTINTSDYSTKSLQNSTVKLQKDRFKSGNQFSSQRFNNSLMPIEELKRNENVKSTTKNSKNNKKNKQRSDMDANSSEDDTIFLDTTTTVSKTQTKQKSNNTRQKRNVDCLDDVPMSAKKKCKTTPINNNKAGQKTKNINGNNDFVFAKPQFPIRKKPIEKLISKSAEPYSNIAVNVQEDNTRVQAIDAPSQEKEAEYKPVETTQHTNSDVSMRPSFIKRKLFTQTLDITERKSNSCESLSTDSPQNNIYSALLREKHKTRKLTTSQSLLSRDVSQDDNNLLDLIHKIVPPSQVNTTNIVKPSHTRVNENKTASDGDDKWDITSILSTCNNDSVSDTYTDDEIFKIANGVKTNNTNKCKEKGKQSKQNKQVDANSGKKTTIDKREVNNDAMAKCNVIVHKLSLVKIPSTQLKSPVADHAKKITLSNSRIDAFWNTDAESDYECPPTPHGLKEKYLNGKSKNDNIATPKQSNIKSFHEVRPNISTNKISKNTKTQLNSLVVTKNDTTLVKALKKQTNKMTNKASTTTLNNTNYKEAQPEQTDKNKKAPTAKLVKTRRQTKNRSAIEESCLSKHDFPARKNCTEANTKQSHTNQSKEKNTKSQPATESTKTRNRSLNNIQSQTDNTKKPKLQKNANHLLQTKDDFEDIQNGTICKVLRSRAIDLSSSFNSDKFELTGLSHVRKSRTPSKRISFNKSRNVTVKKGRNNKLNAK